MQIIDAVSRSRIPVYAFVNPRAISAGPLTSVSEAQVPLALAEASRDGNLCVMDYLKYRNVESDTAALRGSCHALPRDSRW